MVLIILLLVGLRFSCLIRTVIQGGFTRIILVWIKLKSPAIGTKWVSNERALNTADVSSNWWKCFCICSCYVFFNVFLSFAVLWALRASVKLGTIVAVIWFLFLYIRSEENSNFSLTVSSAQFAGERCYQLWQLQRHSNICYPQWSLKFRHSSTPENWVLQQSHPQFLMFATSGFIHYGLIKGLFCGC